MNVYVVSPIDRHLEELLHVSGMHTTRASVDDLSALATQPVVHGQVVVVDMRQRGTMPPGVAQMRQQHPTVGVVIFASSLDPTLMLEAMRAGVTEFVTDPTTQDELSAAIDRVAAKRPPSEVGDVYAFIGGKGGIGTTTLAVNTAAAVARRHPGSALLIDLHAAYGDAALFVGSEPRFSVADALENVNRLDDAFLRSLVGHTKFGLDILASSERAVPESVDVRAVRRLIECAAHHYRYGHPRCATRRPRDRGRPRDGHDDRHCDEPGAGDAAKRESDGRGAPAAVQQGTGGHRGDAV